MEDMNTPEIGGLSESEKYLIAAYRAKDLIALSKIANEGGVIPRGLAELLPLNKATLKQAHRQDKFDVTEQLAFAVLAGLVTCGIVTRTTIFDQDVGSTIYPIAEAIRQALPNIHLSDLAEAQQAELDRQQDND